MDNPDRQVRIAFSGFGHPTEDKRIRLPGSRSTPRKSWSNTVFGEHKSHLAGSRDSA